MPKPQKPDIIIEIPANAEEEAQWERDLPWMPRVIEKELLVLYAKYSQEVMELIPRHDMDGSEALEVVDAIERISDGVVRLLKVVKHFESRRP